jgi:hypothetical protein
VTLPLGKYHFQIRERAGKNEVFDLCRKSFVILTPEEFVRQHLLHYLILDKSYPTGLVKTEHGIQVNETNKRSDIVVFDKEGHVSIICECKASKVKIDFTTIEQIMTYNQTLQAKYFVLSNGVTTLIATNDAGKLIEIQDIPNYQ